MDYKKSGYDRGHLAAAGNHQSNQHHCNETFHLTNMAPQVHESIFLELHLCKNSPLIPVLTTHTNQVGVGFNRNIWNSLEKYTRSLLKTSPNVYVCTGPLYLPRKEADGKRYIKYEVIGPNSVSVPTHFFKIIVFETAANALAMEAYVLPNQAIDDSTPLKAFLVPPESIERHAGLLFFDRIAKEQLKLVNGKKR